VNNAFQLWKVAHDQLTNAIDAYLDACTSFEYSCSRARLSFFEDNSDLETALLDVETELPRLEHNQQILVKSTAVLKRARNLSYTLAPINILPPSVLLPILTMLTDSELATRVFTHQTDRPRAPPALRISRVSTGWRNLALNSPSLWSSIFLRDNYSPDPVNQLCLVRAGNVMLNFQISSLGFQDLQDWLTVLRTRRDQIRALDLVLPDMDSLRNIFAEWPQDAIAPSLKTLSVKIRRTRYCTSVAHQKVLRDGVNERFLQHVTSMSLHGGYFDWECAVFKHLVHLQLVALVEHPGPTFDQIARMLKASPQLRTLCLGDMPIRPDENLSLQSIELNHLEKLSLMSFSGPVLCQLLPLISPGPGPLTLHVNYRFITGPPTDAFIALFGRSNIESIYFHQRISRTTMSTVFSSLPNLRYIHFGDNKHLIPTIQALSAPANKPVLPCPLLHTLHFQNRDFKTSEEFVGQAITTQPTLLVELGSCVDAPSGLSEAVRNRLSGLALGEVVFKVLDPFATCGDRPFHHLSKSNIFGNAARRLDGTYEDVECYVYR
jgi:hypothetical protein